VNLDVHELLERAESARGAAAVALYTEATDLALAGGDLAAATRAVLALARRQRYNTETGMLPARLHDVFVRVEDPAARAGLAASLARTWVYSGQPRRAVPFADTALALAHELNDPVVLADCLDATMAAHWGPDDLHRRREWAEELGDTVAHLREPRARRQAYVWGLTVAFETLDLPRMHRHLRALELLGEEDPEARFFAASRRLAADLLRGRFDTAPYLRRLADEAAEQVFIPDREGIQHAMTTYPALLSGDRDTCAAEAPAYEEFALAEGSTAILAEAAWVWVGAGRLDRAEGVIGQFGPETLNGLPRDADWLLTLQCVMEAALAVGSKDVVANVLELLTPYEKRAVINAGAVMFHGVTDDTLARGHALLGNLDVAARLREQALHTYRRIGAIWWRERLEAHSVGGVPFHATDGGLWRVGPATVPAMRGLEYLHRLLGRPGVEVSALELVSAHTGTGTVLQTGTGPLLDQQAIIAYRRRLARLEAQDVLSRSLAAERDALRDQLGAATGLGGRSRGTGSSTERARVAVRKAVVNALARVAELDADLGRHLYDRVSTGVTCCYTPDPDRPVHWIL
jgi:hypothetical protein